MRYLVAFSVDIQDTNATTHIKHTTTWKSEQENKHKTKLLLEEIWKNCGENSYYYFFSTEETSAVYRYRLRAQEFAKKKDKKKR